MLAIAASRLDSHRAHRTVDWRRPDRALLGFVFVTVNSRITGVIGSSSNPISGMTIATLLLTCLIFVLLAGSGRNIA